MDTSAGQWQSWLAYVMQRGAEAAAIVGVISVVIAVFTYRRTTRETNHAEQTQLMRNSIEVMKIFTDMFVPQMMSYRRRFDQEFARKIQIATNRVHARTPTTLSDSLETSATHQLRRESQTAAGVENLFDKLEQLCAYVKCQLVLESIVYPALHSKLLQFIDDNEESYNALTTPDTPYLSIHFTVDRWRARARHDRIIESVSSNRQA